MPNAFLASLAGLSGGHLGLTTAADRQVDFALHAILQDKGIIISTAAFPFSTSEVFFTNAALLATLEYPSMAAYAAAVAAGDFVHADDLAVVDSHILHKSSAVYDARLKRGDNGNYRKCRLQGMTFAKDNSGPLRIVVISAV